MMKTLQDFTENSWTFNAPFSFSGIIRAPEKPKSLVLLLHGLNERGRRIYRKLGKFLPDDSIILAPNAPFPLSSGISPGQGFAWYFYDKATQTYPLGPEVSLKLLSSLVTEYNSQNLPVFIIGFSQGGYLAPQLAFIDSNVKAIIGIGCEFRRKFIQHHPSFELYGIHGENDPIVPIEIAIEEINYLNNIGVKTKFSACPGEHEITSQMAELIKEYLESGWKK